MPTFFDITSALRHIKQGIDTATEESSHEYKDILHENIRDSVYANSFNPDVYDRTGDFLNSTDSKVQIGSNMNIIDLYNNTDLMVEEHPSWANGMGMQAGSSMNDYIGEFLDKGHGGIIPYKAQRFYEDTERELMTRAEPIFSKVLRNLGI